MNHAQMKGSHPLAAIAESQTIVSALRSGVVPSQGLEALATGLEALVGAVGEELDFVAAGKGLSKWIRGEYGNGKTFAARYLCAQARMRRFATAEVQISINDTPLHHLESVYRRLALYREAGGSAPSVGDRVRRNESMPCATAPSGRAGEAPPSAET